jgi:hypothetical protein
LKKNKDNIKKSTVKYLCIIVPDYLRMCTFNMKKFSAGLVLILLFSVVHIQAQFLVSGNNLFSSAYHIAPGDDSSSYVSGEFLAYEIENEGSPNITSYGFEIGDSVARADSCGYPHFTNRRFISKISKAGVVEWIRISGSCDTVSIVEVLGMTSDSDNNLLVVGAFQGEVEYDGQRLSTAAARDMFLYKFSPSGEMLWRKSGFALGDTSEVIPGDLVTMGNTIYLSGSYRGSALFSGEDFLSLQKQFFLLQLDENGLEVEVRAGVPLHDASTSDLPSVDIDVQSDIAGILTVKDSVLMVRKQAGFLRDTLYAVTGFEQEVLYVVDSVDIDQVTAVVDSFYTEEPPDPPHWYYLATAGAITDPAIILDSVYRSDPSRPVTKHHVAVFRGDTIALSSPLPAVPLDFRVDRNDDGLYGLYNYDDALDFGPDHIPAPVYPSALLVKHKFEGGTDWYKTGTCSTDTVQATAFSIDRNSNIYLAGSVGRTVGSHILNFDGQVFSASTDEDCFVLKLESGSVAWGQILGDSGTDRIHDLYATDRFNIVALGAYSKKLEYDRFSIQTSGIRDLFAGTIDPYPNFDLEVISHLDETLPLCEGDSVLLTGHTSHGVQFQWMKDSIAMPGETGDSLWVTTSGSYTLRAASMTITRDDPAVPYIKTSRSVDLSYNPYPNDSIAVQDTTIFCYGEQSTLIIETGAGDSCSWYSISDGFLVSESYISVTETNGYYARIESAEGCISLSDTIDITAIPLPDDSLVIQGGNHLFCSGDSVRIESVDPGNNRYTWFMDGDSLTTGSSPVVSLGVGGACFVEIVNDRNCVVRSDTIDLVEITPPVLSQWFDDADSGICEGDASEIRLSSHSQTEYTWFFNGDTIADAFSPVLLAEAEGDYSASLVKEGVCFASSETFFLAVHELPQPVIGISPDSVICDNEYVLLTASSPGDVNYRWLLNGEPMVDSLAPSIRVSEAGAYAAEVTNGWSCSALTRSIPVVVKRSPRLTLESEGGITAFCMNDSLRMFVQNISGILYQWQREGQAMGHHSQSVYAFEAGDYRVLLEDTLTGCVGQTNMVSLTTWELPDPDLIYTDRNPLCDRDTVLVSTGATAAVYAWYRNDEQLILEKGNSLQVTGDGRYYLSLTDEHNCKAVSDPVTFNFLDNPVPPIQQDVSYLFTTDFDQLQWYRDDVPVSGSTGQVYLVDESGYYYVEVTYENGCRAASDEIRVCDPFPVIELTRNVLTASEGETYQWFFGQDTIFGATEKRYEAQLTGIYSVAIGLPDGCISMSEGVEVCYPVPEVEIEPDNVLKSSLGLSYQWYKDNAPIAGADARLYVVSATGEYKVEVTDLDGCISFSDPVYLDLTGVAARSASLRIYPNPASEGVYIEVPVQMDPSRMVVKLHNTMGEVLMQQVPVSFPLFLSLEELSPGFYILMVEDEAIQLREIIIKR